MYVYVCGRGFVFVCWVASFKSGHQKKLCLFCVLEFLLSKCVEFPKPCIFDVGSVCVRLFWC